MRGTTQPTRVSMPSRMLGERERGRIQLSHRQVFGDEEEQNLNAEVVVVVVMREKSWVRER
jgi:hypothetical protein